MQNWPFAEPSWWIDAIYSIAGFPLPSGVTVGIADTTSTYRTLGSINSAYEDTLLTLSVSDMSEFQAREVLFGAKALRKWAFSESCASAAERSYKAKVGFIERNHAARQASYFGVSPTLRWVMRNELRRLLPEIPLESALGKFGPGEVAEHLSHPRRFMQLGRWCRLPHWPDFPTGDRAMNHDTARLSAVPKQYDKDRLITVEPSYASFVQQWVRSLILESVHSGPLRGSAMDLGYTDGQAIQRRLAQKASMDRSLATLDLKDASDRITWDIVQDVFPDWVVRLLEVSRSPFITAEIDGSRIREKTFVFAGMGNASTFAVETLFFTAYVRAVALIEHRKTFVSVFGDDVICDTTTAMSLLNYESSYFVINRTKSFYRIDDKIRESCGIFCYNGKDITVPRIDGYSDSYEGRLGLCDLVERLCTLGEQVDLRFSALAAHIVTTGRKLGIPNYQWKFMGYPSFHCCYVDYDAVPEVRRNRDWQYVEGRFAVPSPKTRLVSVSRPDDLSFGLYQGWFCGQVHTIQANGKSYVPFPIGKYRIRKRWLRGERCF